MTTAIYRGKSRRADEFAELVNQRQGAFAQAL
jgi:hypothetical protein